MYVNKLGTRDRSSLSFSHSLHCFFSLSLSLYFTSPLSFSSRTREFFNTTTIITMRHRLVCHPAAMDFPDFKYTRRETAVAVGPYSLTHIAFVRHRVIDEVPWFINVSRAQIRSSHVAALFIRSCKRNARLTGPGVRLPLSQRLKYAIWLEGESIRRGAHVTTW